MFVCIIGLLNQKRVLKLFLKNSYWEFNIVTEKMNPTSKFIWILLSQEYSIEFEVFGKQVTTKKQQNRKNILCLI